MTVGRPVVIALPGFTRGPQHLARLSAACDQQAWDCIRPTLAPRWMPVLYMRPARLRRIARRLSTDLAGRRVVVAGHSAGAAAACALAVDLRALRVDVCGAVLIDGVDSPNHLIACTLPDLIDLRVAAVLAPPSPCNRHAQLERFLESYPSVRREVVGGAGHGDIEGAGLAVYRRACGDRTDEAAADLMLSRVMAAIDWVLGGGDGDPHP